MALSGTLSDMNMIDLIQFPHSGRKTGELKIIETAAEEEARLYYDQGNLVHASLGIVEGEEVLVQIVDWLEGNFEFLADVSAERQSIERDLHRAVMYALKTRDERKMEEDNKKTVKEADDRSHMIKENVSKKLSQFISSNAFTLYAGVISSDKSTLIEVSRDEGPPEGTEQLRNTLQQLLDTYPRTGLIRFFFEDDLGTVVCVCLDESHALIVIADKGASLGAVSISAGKAAADLTKGEG